MAIKQGSGNLGMVGKASHQHKIDLMGGFGAASKPNHNRSDGKKFMMSGAGTPRSTAQMASVNKAAKASAAARGERASLNPNTKASAAPSTPLATPNPAKKGSVPGFSTGGVSLAKNNKGLLSL